MLIFTSSLMKNEKSSILLQILFWDATGLIQQAGHLQILVSGRFLDQDQLLRPLVGASFTGGTEHQFTQTAPQGEVQKEHRLLFLMAKNHRLPEGMKKISELHSTPLYSVSNFRRQTLGLHYDFPLNSQHFSKSLLFLLIFLIFPF